MTKVALVSGGSRGIGSAVVQRLAQDGFDVSFCYRSDSVAADVLGKEVTALGVRALTARADVTDVDAVDEWLARTKEELGPIDVVVTSAGITRDKPLALMETEDWGQVLRTNLDGVFNVCRPVVFDMMKRRTGTLVTLSSVSGVYGNPTQTNYSASKSGVIGFTKALAKEVGRFGIRANAVAPGMIDTDMLAELAAPARKKLLDAIPLRRFGRADEVADLVSFLVSDRAAYITGSVVEVTGGLVV
ncbi:MAG: 3-oxoacyl-(acyl-carrier-protein) reductase [Amycolatopsis sp.]|jgi:3-oxoacyl-[acyl-carrier protein] reductase|uniref:3-oxoacyl-ACP reductase FabG n=1 Tax=Amycolatopsis sp. TaxID=37632 RepID=UPI002634F1C6|nr:3-oxoacyl-ACP reductase FabG [Amycolatopsis sp.]MCU1686670.1 3-oxoacyl-(acyl-carrier-protein) reductase [Amycolatopsis sp.]